MLFRSYFVICFLMRQVKLVLDNEEIEGLLVKEDDKHLTVKLSNGYNIGIARYRIKQIIDVAHVDIKNVDAKHHTDSIVSKSYTDTVKLPKILILHTGGTIASRVDYRTGGAIASFTPEDIIAMFPELKNIARIESELFRNMWSEDIRFVHYNLMAKKISEVIKNDPEIKGVIITHGTDTIQDRKSTRLNSSHVSESRMPSSA